MAIFMAEARPKWQTGSRIKITPGNDSIRHFMCHITFQYNGQHDFEPFLTIPAIHLCLEGVKKKLIFRVKIVQLWQASSRAGNPIAWKPFHVPYHLPIYGTAWLWTIFDHPSHLSIPGGGQCSPLQAFDWYYSGIATVTKNEKNALCLGTELVMLLQTILSKYGCFFFKRPPPSMKKKENQSTSRKVDAGTCCVNRKPVNGNIVYASQRQDLLLQPFDLVILNILIRVFS